MKLNTDAPIVPVDNLELIKHLTPGCVFRRKRSVYIYLGYTYIPSLSSESRHYAMHALAGDISWHYENAEVIMLPDAELHTNEFTKGTK